MNTKLVTGTFGLMLLLAPLTFAQDDQKPAPTSPTKTTQVRTSEMSEDMRQAIAWERAKDRAAAHQAAIEARHLGGDQNADRTMDDRDPGRKVKDTEAPGAKRDQ
jgi:hypothetical protein